VIEDRIKQQVYSKIFNFVAGIPRTNKEVRERLQRYVSKIELDEGEKETLIAETLEMLNQDCTIDDARYAHDYVVNSQLSTKPRSLYKIKQFLYKKGIPEKIIESELQQVSGSFDGANAQKDLEKLSRRFQKLEGFVLRNKLTSHLIRKGYPSDVVYNVVDTYLGVK